MWDRILHVVSFAKWLYKANRLIPGSEKHEIRTTARDINGLFHKTSTHLSFTEEEGIHGNNELQKLGYQRTQSQ